MLFSRVGVGVGGSPVRLNIPTISVIIYSYRGSVQLANAKLGAHCRGGGGEGYEEAGKHNRDCDEAGRFESRSSDEIPLSPAD